ncbi:hypothetical protein ACPW96_20745 [Micromonospora sp. DT81.3]|uniref:DUF7882 family protein n=1 Tax=Micromonospora sp. DT81.3 TaxID=3416523 RepID=UPI003CF75D8D
MGKLTYGTVLRADFDDRTLWHLQAVIGSKMRRGESFHFSWKDDNSIGGGSSSVWVHPNCSMMYRFHDSRRPVLNRAWLDALMKSANSHTGLVVVPEPSDPGGQVGSGVELPGSI